MINQDTTTRPAWADSTDSFVLLFNVGRGLCIFIRTPHNRGILYDLGASDDFVPIDFLKENVIPYLTEYQNSEQHELHSLAQVILSHPHADHIASVASLKDDVTTALLTCPHDIKDDDAEPEQVDWDRVNNQPHADPLMKTYQSLFADGQRSLPLQTMRADDSDTFTDPLEYAIHYVRPPVVAELFPGNDQEYTNGLSLVLWYRHGPHTMLIPGDLNPDTFAHLLESGHGLQKRHTVFHPKQTLLGAYSNCENDDQPSMKDLLGEHGLSILVAPHHGLESGYSQDLFDAIDGKPRLVAISESRKTGEGHGSVHANYQSSDYVEGFDIGQDGQVETRYSVSTKQGHHMLFLFRATANQPIVILEKDPKTLLGVVNGFQG